MITTKWSYLAGDVDAEVPVEWQFIQLETYRYVHVTGAYPGLREWGCAA